MQKTEKDSGNIIGSGCVDTEKNTELKRTLDVVPPANVSSQSTINRPSEDFVPTAILTSLKEARGILASIPSQEKDDVVIQRWILEYLDSWIRCVEHESYPFTGMSESWDEKQKRRTVKKDKRRLK